MLRWAPRDILKIQQLREAFNIYSMKAWSNLRNYCFSFKVGFLCFVSAPIGILAAIYDVISLVTFYFHVFYLLLILLLTEYKSSVFQFVIPSSKSLSKDALAKLPRIKQKLIEYGCYVACIFNNRNGNYSLLELFCSICMDIILLTLW